VGHPDAVAQSLERLAALTGSVTDEEVRDQLEAEIVELTAQTSGLVTAFRLLQADNDYLARLSRRDEPTGLYNHRHFMERLDEEYRRALRYATPLSVLIADIDDFKLVNDARVISSATRCSAASPRHSARSSVRPIPLPATAATSSHCSCRRRVRPKP
jgi:predicted signal transduction protein with EAL and GGDEF domain